jgi:hypothetical protein
MVARVGIVALLAVLTVLAAGCTSGRRTLSLTMPEPEGTGGRRADGDAGTARVVSVTDAREFRNKPPRPSTPSVDGDVNDLTPVERARMIGRQRNKYGHAEGDIALARDGSVPREARRLVEEGLRRRGYRVVGEGGAADVTVAVTVEQFWAWCTPAYWFTMFEARVRCRLDVTRSGRTRTFEIGGHGLNPGQVAADRNWEQAYERAYGDFLDDLEDALRRL